MKKLMYIVGATLVSACSNAQQKDSISDSSNIDSVNLVSDTFLTQIEEKRQFDTVSSGLNHKPSSSYKIEKSKIYKQRNELSFKYSTYSNRIEQDKLLDLASIVFTNFLLNNIIPHWYETVWDFNGHTSKPKEGLIACGYFVSTTLKDMGLNLNRYTLLAQQDPNNEAKSIAIDLSEMRYFEEGIDKVLKNLEEGIYFLGLDNHVGYLYKKSDYTYFIYSNYIEGKVMIEDTKYSEAFYSVEYYISEITNNKALMKKWLKKEEVKIVIE